MRLCPVVVLVAAGSTLMVPVARAQTGPTPHPLGARLAVATQQFSRIGQLVSLSDGRVFVSDAAKRQVWLFDDKLGSAKVVLDSAAGRANSFTALSFLMPFRGDSALFFDRVPSVFVVIHPDGSLGRTFAPPSTATEDPLYVTVLDFGAPRSSKTFGLVYTRPGSNHVPAIPRPSAGQPPIVTRISDSIEIMRWDYTTRTRDTVAFLASGGIVVRTTTSTGGSVSGAPLPFHFVDDAVVTTDGSIALFHAQDYRIEWIGSDGVRSAGARIPFAWQRIADAERMRLVDSINARRRVTFDSLVAKRAADSARTGAPPMISMSSMGPDGVRATRQAPASPPRMGMLAVPEDIPDFYPPTAENSVLADGDNNVWLRRRPLTADPDAPAIWDVVNRKGELTERVSVPPTQKVVGFGPGGVIYTTVVDGGVLSLIKSRVR